MTPKDITSPATPSCKECNYEKEYGEPWQHVHTCGKTMTIESPATQPNEGSGIEYVGNSEQLKHIERVITDVLINKIKFIGDGEHTYLGTPQELIDDLTTHLLASYEAGVAEGRSSMKRDIEAVVPGKEQEINFSPIAEFKITQGEKDRRFGWNACRSQLLDNIKRIV